jgi:hypothetical protein
MKEYTNEPDAVKVIKGGGVLDGPNSLLECRSRTLEVVNPT